MQKYFTTLLILLVATLLPNCSRAQDVDWADAIKTVERSASSYSDYAFKELGSRWVGPANDSIKFGTHRCAILGRMLGLPEAIKHIETFDYPPLGPPSDAFDLLVFSLTLENWVAAARASLAMKHDERINIWNLDCVGSEGIPGNLFIESGQPNATFEVKGRTLVVYGDISDGFYESISSQLQANPTIEEVALGSGGGSVREALLAGYEIRQLGLSTTLHGNCFSACPLVFMGGVERILWAAPHRLGFHQIYTGNGNAISGDHPTYKIVAEYLTDMGIDARVVLSWMLSARPNEIFEPAVSELCAPKVSTFVQRICGF